MDKIDLGLNQLEEYYVINKNQARNSFHISLFAIIVGFLTIVYDGIRKLALPHFPCDEHCLAKLHTNQNSDLRKRSVQENRTNRKAYRL